MQTHVYIYVYIYIYQYVFMYTNNYMNKKLISTSCGHLNQSPISARLGKVALSAIIRTVFLRYLCMHICQDI
jgi:hypothetical protein